MTTDLGKFGNRERLLAAELLTAWAKTGWPDHFGMENVQLYLEAKEGDVYLTNEDGEFAALTDDGTIKRYYFSKSGVYGGFFDDLKEEYSEMDEESKTWFRGIAEEIGRESELPEIEEN